jgi:TctA family transporter
MTGDSSEKANLLALGREILTGAISLSIVGISLVLLWNTYQAAEQVNNDKDVMRFASLKDILSMAFSLLGTVTGYYLGRVPAESFAEAAKKTAEMATQKEKETRMMVRKEIDELLSSASALDATTRSPDDTINQLKLGLRSLRDRI